MEGDNIEHKQFWERIEKIKSNFSVNNIPEKQLEAEILQFRYTLMEELKSYEYIGEKKNKIEVEVLKSIIKKYDEHFNIVVHTKGEIRPIDINKCEECGETLSQCKCTENTVNFLGKLINKKGKL